MTEIARKVDRTRYDLEWSSRELEDKNCLEGRIVLPGNSVFVGPSFQSDSLPNVTMDLFLFWRRGSESIEDVASLILRKEEALRSIGVSLGIGDTKYCPVQVDGGWRVKFIFFVEWLTDTAPIKIALFVHRMCEILEIRSPVVMTVLYEFEICVPTEQGEKWMPEGRYLLDKALVILKKEDGWWITKKLRGWWFKIRERLG